MAKPLLPTWPDLDLPPLNQRSLPLWTGYGKAAQDPEFKDLDDEEQEILHRTQE